MSYLADTTGVRGVIRPSSAGLAQTFFVWGAQTNVGTLQSYIATTTTAYYGPRFDYDPITLVCKGLLIEEARTNSIRNNTGVGVVAGTPGTLPTNWATNTSAGLTQTTSAAFVENGITYVDVSYSGTATSSVTAFIAFETVSVAASVSQVWTTSTYVTLTNRGGAPVVSLGGREYSGTSVLLGLDTSVITPGSGALSVNRSSVTSTLAQATTAFFRPTIELTFVNLTAYDFTLRLGLPQLELGAFATSVIPTATATATRPRDTATMTGINFSSWYNQTEGTVAVNIQWEGLKSTSSQTILQIDDGTTANRIVFAASSSNSLLNVVTSASVATNVLTPANTYVAATSYKHAFAVSNLDFQLAINGTLGTQVTTGAMPISVNALRFGTNLSTFASIWFQSLAYYPTRLPNATLQAITR
jgi:hypothetical protein